MFLTGSFVFTCTVDEGDSEQDDWEIHGSLTVSEKNTTNPITTVTLPTAPVWSGSSCSNNGMYMQYKYNKLSRCLLIFLYLQVFYRWKTPYHSWKMPHITAT